MAISQTKYINIVSSVGASSAVTQRDLIARIFTSNYLAPNGTIIEFSGGPVTALALVGEYFGTTSTEYNIASKYFGFVSKKSTQPQKISFARFSSTESAATLAGSRNASSLDAIKSITSGTLSVSVGGEVTDMTGINLSTATSFADVATLLNTELTTATVAASFSYDATNYRFVLTTTETGSDAIIGYASGTIADALGLTEVKNAIISAGANAQSATDCLTESSSVSNNFFTFDFIPDVSSSAESIASWVNSQNVRYMWSATVTPENYATIQSAVESYSGVALTVDAFSDRAGFMPMSMFAAIDWSKPNSAINAMYQQFNGVQPTVTTDADKAKYDAVRVNYYGATQQAGQSIAFYQNGVLQGDITDMGVFANEAWLKDAFFTAILNLRLGLDSLPANSTGKGLVLGSMQSVIDQGLFNGVIIPGKTLDSAQKAYITQTSGNDRAWMNVQSSGYWVDAEVVKYTEASVEKYKVNYTLIYSKGDSINKVDGSDILI